MVSLSNHEAALTALECHDLVLRQAQDEVCWNFAPAACGPAYGLSFSGPTMASGLTSASNSSAVSSPSSTADCFSVVPFL